MARTFAPESCGPNIQQSGPATKGKQGTYRCELALERTRKRVLPKADLIGKLGASNSESLRSDVHALVAMGIRKKYQRSGEVGHKERCGEGQSDGDHDESRVPKLTVIAVVNVNAVTVVETLEGIREVLVKLKVVRV